MPPTASELFCLFTLLLWKVQSATTFLKRVLFLTLYGYIFGSYNIFGDQNVCVMKFYLKVKQSDESKQVLCRCAVK